VLAKAAALTLRCHRLKKVRRAKRGVRGELSVSGGEWSRHGYAHTPILRCPRTRALLRGAPRVLTATRASAPLERSEEVHDTLPRVDARHVSLEARGVVAGVSRHAAAPQI
jgi:hypothetical protein